MADVLRVQAQVDWILWDRIVSWMDRGEAEILASDAPGIVKKVELSALPADVGRELKMSEFTVARIAAQAGQLRDHAPSAWVAFSEGRIDEAKAREISSAVERLERAESIERLDRQVVGYAESHTVVELRRWLKVFIARVEADLFNERAQDARDNRDVQIVHGQDGMGQLIADLPSTWLAAIDKRAT